MAGIGFELKKIYGRKTLAANLWGTFYAIMTTIGPTVISALLMLVLNYLLAREDLTVLEGRFFIASVTYAFLIALLVAVLFSSPVSRYIADCIYLEKEEDIFPSAFGVMTIASVLSGLIMLALCVGMYLDPYEVPMTFIVAYYFLGVLMTATYSMMTYASALKHYVALTVSFFLGFLLAIVVYLICNNWLAVDKVTAACLALTSCYFLVTFALVFQCMRAFGAPQGRYFAFLEYFRRYPKLAIGGAAYMLGLYCPTIIYWFLSDMAEKVCIFRTIPPYDSAMFLAFVVNVPSLVIFVVKVETAFYEKFSLYVSALNNGPLDLIQKERSVMARALLQQLFFVYEVQLITTVILICLVTVFFPYLNASISMLNVFILLSLGICSVFCMYFTIVVFQYFSDYNGAYISSLIFLIITIIGSLTAALGSEFYLLSLPLLLGGLCGWILCFLLVRRRMKKLDSFLMC